MLSKSLSGVSPHHTLTNLKVKLKYFISSQFSGSCNLSLCTFLTLQIFNCEQKLSSLWQEWGNRYGVSKIKGILCWNCSIENFWQIYHEGKQSHLLGMFYKLGSLPGVLLMYDLILSIISSSLECSLELAQVKKISSQTLKGIVVRDGRKTRGGIRNQAH